MSHEFQNLINTLRNVEDNVNSGKFKWGGGERQHKLWLKQFNSIQSMLDAQILLDMADKHAFEIRNTPINKNLQIKPKAKKWWGFLKNS